jgi:hypothetical protein
VESFPHFYTYNLAREMVYNRVPIGRSTDRNENIIEMSKLSGTISVDTNPRDNRASKP